MRRRQSRDHGGADTEHPGSTRHTLPPETEDLWDQGWYMPAIRLDSPNFGPRPEGACIDLLVLHSISLPPGQYGGKQVQDLFTNQLDWDAHPYFGQIRGLQVSSHFYIRRDGALWQFVSADDRAWHAGQSAYRGRANCFEDAQYQQLARLCQDLRHRYPITHIAGHQHIAPGRKHDPGSGFNWPRLRSLLPCQFGVFPEVEPSD